ncbi:uncharacterized protein TRUGW13939_00496 [Talaromyces rugulosus]|uniref:Transcriptional regulator Ngg1 n=1 Tax=Talaromyces rugulosus TaxID=121627 RepID=A0A7H8QHH3_TALRU|nr:uncharacterized protein TRUGW13939_00496 [Talaromyces rugulosus]QKX53417.1 hypothetical protein TRUGW13939_00496 [Talaromyces rugulosus]
MPLANKSKTKGRDARQSRSRNTTPSSGHSASTTTGASAVSGYLENDLGKLFSQTSVQYVDILDQVGGSGSIPDVRSLEQLSDQLKTLSQLADARGDICNAAMRELSQRKKDVVEDSREQEMERDTEDRKMKREADDEDEPSRALKGGKLKKRKERPSKEDRPLAVGSHEVTRQDGGELGVRKRSLEATSPSSKKSRNAATGSSSSLSPPSLASPPLKAEAEAADSPSSEDSDDSRQPEPAQLVPQFQVFGPNPLKFDDPTVYHIRDVTSETTDDEKREIFSVAHFPPSDLSHMMAGVAPDKDFSNAKPTSQVNANTFLTWVEPFVRPLTEEDIAFLKEKGDRTTPFVMPRRAKKHYSEVWAEEDGAMSIDNSNDRDRLPLNQGRGSIEQLTDENAETDKVSVGPLVSRLYSLLRYEHRTETEENSNNNGTTNGDTSMNSLLGDSFMDLDHQPLNGESENKPLPAATSFPDASPNNFKVPAAKLEHAQLDERLKAELRYVGFFGPEDNPDFDAHYDDDIAQRLRLLQGELKKQMLINGARKTRLMEIAKERMAYQEYSTIHDDLDSQVQQAYLKRTRTLGKSKKGSQAKHRPGGAGGGSHVVSAAGVGRPGIGDMARTLMDRRKRWRDCIGPVFKDSKTTVPSRDESIFDTVTMAEYEKAELEGWDEEQE